MSKYTKRASVLLILFTVLAIACNANAAPIDPFEYFNAYSLNDIGSSSDVYNTDIEGTMGAAGNAYFGSFGAPNLQGNEYVLHTGGDLYLGSGSLNGNLDIGGNLHMHNAAYYQHASVGGDALFHHGNMVGSLDASGSVTCYSAGGCANMTGGVAYNPVFNNFDDLNQYFLDTSANIGAMSVTGEGSTYYSTLTFNATSGVNVFDVNASEIYSTMTSIVINGPSDAIVYINAQEAIAHLGWSMNWFYNGGITANNVLLNFENATELTLRGGSMNVLAPLADVNFTSGALNGVLVGGNLFGGAQVNLGSFTPPAPVPEPGTFVLLGIGLAGLVGFRKKYAKQ